MVAGWRRIAAGAGIVLCGVLVTGCHAQGTFDVISEDRVGMDLVVTGDDIDCPNAVDALKLTITTISDDTGHPACHVTGETQATYFSPFGINVSSAAEYLVLQANLSGGRDDWPTCDIQVRFPGQVVSATKGQPLGNTVRITDLGPLAQGSGLRVIALTRPGPPAWMIAAGAGVGAGVLVTLLVLGIVWLARRRPSRATRSILLDPAEPPVDGAEAALPKVQGEPSVAAAADGDPPAPDESPPDPTWFAAPTHRGPSTFDGTDGARPDHADASQVVTRVGSESDAEPVDHTIWAPPDDHR